MKPSLRTSTWLGLLAALLLLPALPAQEEEAKDGDQKQDEELELTLENIFPEKGLFGPSARGAEFSFDGRYAAWLYRPYDERRHGSDLWVRDSSTGEVRRITSVSVLAPFQKDTREVAKDRVKKAKKAAKGKKGKKKEEGAGDGDSEEEDVKSDEAAGKQDREREDAKKELDEKQLQDTVDEDDFDDEDAPRYSGVSGFEWAPGSNELLFLSGGDIYRLKLMDGSIERLTKTRERERDVQYLPDGSGYTYLRDDALLRVVFGTHYVDQLDPELPRGQSMRGYELSPDGQKVVFLASSGSRDRGGARTVNIATYTDRFMKVREVPRTVSDDPQDKSTTTVYLYAMPDPDKENGQLVKVYSHQRSGPRDQLRVPNWSPDSERAAFSVFEQSSGHVNILVAEFPEEEEAPEQEEGAGDGEDEGGKEKAEKNGDKPAPKKEEPDPDEPIDLPAKVAYRFLHNGGPNTPRMIDPEYLKDGRRLVFLTEQSGFRHLHVLDPVYESLEQLTRGHFEVYPLDLPEHREFMFVEATKEDPSRLDVYRLDFADGSLTRMTPQVGSYSSAAVSPDGSQLLAGFAAYGSLRELVHVDVASQAQTALTDSHPEKAEHFTQAAPEFFQYQNRHGQTIHGHLFKPDGWTKEDQRPLLIYVYGGPLGTRKQVVQGGFSSDSYFFAHYMAKKHGYLTCTIDPRGMSGYGAAFEKANFEQVGKPQVEDLADGVKHLIAEYGVKHLIAEYGVDPERVGIHGWSFGGFQTQMCLYTEPDVFQVGIAGAGPTEWENYNSWYSTGTIGPSREGETDLKQYSLLPLAKQLEGKLLLVHGMEDSNVLYQDTVRVYAELLEAGKEALVELFLDPTGGHGLGGHVKRVGRARKYEEFLLRTLGEGALPEAEAEAKAEGGDEPAEAPAEAH